MEEQDNEKRERREDVFSEVLRAGKRTYFFDVRVTSNDDYYLTITESKKRFDNRQGRFYYEKHKIFLYKEDFDNFMDSFAKTVEFIKTERPVVERRQMREDAYKQKAVENPQTKEVDDAGKENFSNVEFEDLGKKSNEKEDKS